MKMLLPIRRVAERIGRGKSWIRAELKRDGSDFPKPEEIDGYDRAVWDSEKLDHFIETRKARARQKRAANASELRV